MMGYGQEERGERDREEEEEKLNTDNYFVSRNGEVFWINQHTRTEDKEYMPHWYTHTYTRGMRKRTKLQTSIQKQTTIVEWKKCTVHEEEEEEEEPTN